METVASVLDSMNMVSLDLSDMYIQVQVHPHSRMYLRLIWQDKVFQFKVLMAPVSSWAHRLNITLRRYLDDWLATGPTL